MPRPRPRTTSPASPSRRIRTSPRKRRPARLMRVPDENHELTRSGTPFRRIENHVQVRDWFAHFLVEGRRGLPRLPRSSRP